MGDAPTEIEPAAGAPPADGAPPDPATSRPTTLVELADAVEMTDVGSAESTYVAIGPAAGRLRDLAEWHSGTQGRWPALAPARPRLVTRAPVTEAVAAVAGSIRVGVEVLTFPDSAADGDTADGMDVEQAFAAGVAAADAQVDAGTDVVVLADAANPPAAAALISLVTDAEPVALLPRGAEAIDTDAWIERAGQVRDLRRSVHVHRRDPDALLAALGDPGLALTCGFLMRVVTRRTAVLLDGTGALAAAALCRRSRERVGRWLRIADTSPDPVHAQAVAYLDQRPVLDLETRLGDGLAGLQVITMLRATVELGRESKTEGRT